MMVSRSNPLGKIIPSPSLKHVLIHLLYSQSVCRPPADISNKQWTEKNTELWKWVVICVWKEYFNIFLCTNAVTFYMQLRDFLWFYILAPACNVCAIMLYAQGKRPNIVILHWVIYGLIKIKDVVNSININQTTQKCVKTLKTIAQCYWKRVVT